MRALAGAALVAALVPANADACQCKRGLEESAKAATSVFVAQVQSMTCTAKPLKCSYEVKVETVWRGKLAGTVTINAPLDDCMHPLDYQPGERIAFVLQNGKLSLSVCDGSQKATADVIARLTKALGAPNKLP